MRSLKLAAASLLAATAVPSAASAQYPYADRGDYREYRQDIRQAQRQCNRALRNADTRREYRQAQRFCRSEVRDANRDYRREVRSDYRDWRRDRDDDDD